MTEGLTTVLDLAHAAMEAAPEDDAARLRFYERVADAELFLLLADEAEGDRIAPRLFPLEDGPFVLAFDREERLAEFADGPAPYAALPGRVVVRMLAEQSIGLGLNLGVAPSEILLPPEALVWLAQTLAAEPGAAEALPQTFLAPGRLPQPLLAALQAKLAMMGGLAAAALLAGVAYADGRQGHMLAFIGAAPAAEPALAKAVAEALTFSGIEAGELDVTFLSADSAAARAMARVALRLDLPQPEQPAEPAAPGPKGPGMDPTKPPILR
ncbi:SseB family protein [Frigidibacter oleivorans]|uniref:SseB family protein n=1 Tax=Frigidibacter oleivorans TaxID=2487129 RepID=UPI000F8F0535|nr:SseB family protein [Frigidibacter oleivorans]